MTISLDNKDAIEDRGKDVMLMLEADTLGYIIARFQECIETNSFALSELCEVSVSGGRGSDNDLYGILIK